jgi:hypothetical protein
MCTARIIKEKLPDDGINMKNGILKDILGAFAELFRHVSFCPHKM